MHRHLGWTAVILIAVGGLLAACGNGSDARHKVGVFREPVLPASVRGLHVEPENVDKAIKGLDESYIDRLGLYSFRNEEDVLQATIQVSEFSADARPGELAFRETIAGQVIGTGEDLRRFRMGDRIVYLGGSVRQTLAVWFSGNQLLVLVVRGEYEFPRALLRDLVQLDIGNT